MSPTSLMSRMSWIALMSLMTWMSLTPRMVWMSRPPQQPRIACTARMSPTAWGEGAGQIFRSRTIPDAVGASTSLLQHFHPERTFDMTKHLEAVETALSAQADRLTEADAPLIELCRALARQVDEAGPNASTRLTASYLSCLKDLRRVMSANS